MLTFYSHL